MQVPCEVHSLSDSPWLGQLAEVQYSRWPRSQAWFYFMDINICSVQPTNQSINKHLLSACYTPAVVLGAGCTKAETKILPSLKGFIFYWGEKYDWVPKRRQQCLATYML